jgi:hypothetical protein
MIQDAVNNFLRIRNSKIGTVTEANLVHQMIEDKSLVTDMSFDNELDAIKKSGEFWVDDMDDPTSLFPGPNVGEKSTVQPFFVDVLEKFATICAGNKIVYRKGKTGDKAGKYRVRMKLGNIFCIPDASVHNAPTVGSRKPDVNVYYQTVGIKGTLRIISSWELKARSGVGNPAFSPEEVGQLIDTNFELFRQQPFRTFSLAVLSDGVRFVFFKIMKIKDDFKVLQSSMYFGMDGWSVRII